MHATREEQRVTVVRWADKYTTRLEDGLTGHWRDLTDRIAAGLDKLSLYELSFGPGDSFGRTVVTPAVEAWVARFIEPVLREAGEEFRATVRLAPEWRSASPDASVQPAGELGITDVLQGLLLPGGMAVGYGAVTAAIVTTTKVMIFTTVAINWPLMIAGLALGSVLACFGVYRLADLRQRLKKRFEERVTGHLRESLIGEGIKHKGKLTPSLLAQLQGQIRATAAAARERLAKEGEQ